MFETEIEEYNIFFEKYGDNIKEEIKKFVIKGRIQLNHIKNIVIRYDKSVTKQELSDEEIFDNKVFSFIEEYLMENNITIGGIDLSLNNEVEDLIYDRTKKGSFNYTEVRKKSCDSKENVALAKKIKKGDKSAKDRMVEGNIGLVYSYIIPRIKYLWVKVGNDEIDDLIQEGCMGLMKAIDKYDYEKGNFSTYAYYWIKQRIDRAVKENAKGYKIPVNWQEQIGKIDRVIYQFENSLGRKPTKRELADQLDMSTQRIEELLIARTRNNVESLDEVRKEKQDLYDYDYNMSFEDEISNFEKASKRHKINLHKQKIPKEMHKIIDELNDVDKPENYDSTDTFILDGVYLDESEPDIEEYITMGNTNEYSQFDKLLTKDLEEAINMQLKGLKKNEADVLEKRFGKNVINSMTLEEVGKVYKRLDGSGKVGVTKEVVRQVEAKALRKLRHPSRSKVLKDYMDIDKNYEQHLNENLKQKLIKENEKRNEELEGNISRLDEVELELFMEYFSRRAEKKDTIPLFELLEEKEYNNKEKIITLYDSFFDCIDQKKVLKALREEKGLREKQNNENKSIKDDTKLDEEEYEQLENEFDIYFEDEKEDIKTKNNELPGAMKNDLDFLSNEELEKFIQDKKEIVKKKDEEIENKKNEISMIEKRNKLLAQAKNISEVVNSQNAEILNLNNKLNNLKLEQK